VLLATPQIGTANYAVTVNFASGSSTNKAGLIFSHNGANSYYAVVLNRSKNEVALYQVSSGSWGSALATAGLTINDSTDYTLYVTRRQRRVEVRCSTASLSYNFTADPDTGKSGLYADTLNVTFDDFQAFATDARNPLVPRIVGTAKGSQAEGINNQLLVEGSDARGGVAEVDRFQDDDYSVLVDVTMNSGTYAEIWFRRVDPENGYIAYLGSDGTIRLDEMVNGSRSTVASDTYTTGTTVSVRIVADEDDLDVPAHDSRRGLRPPMLRIETRSVRRVSWVNGGYPRDRYQG